MNPVLTNLPNLHSTAFSIRMQEISNNDWTDRFCTWVEELPVTCRSARGLGKGGADLNILRQRQLACHGQLDIQGQIHHERHSRHYALLDSLV